MWRWLMRWSGPVIGWWSLSCVVVSVPDAVLPYQCELLGQELVTPQR